jgi:hypothetical protein
MDELGAGDEAAAATARPASRAVREREFS